MGVPKNFKPRRHALASREEQQREKQSRVREVVRVAPASQPAHERLAARAEKYRETDLAQKVAQYDARGYRPYYIIRRDRHFTDAKKEIFVFTVGELGTTATAAEAAGIGIQTALNHRNPNHAQYDQDFAEAWQEAVAEYNAGVEREIHERAINGWEEPVFGGKDKDRIVGHITKKSDRMLTLLAKRRMPKEYGDKVEVKQTGKVTGIGTEIAPGIDITNMSLDQRKKLKAFLTSMDGVDRSEIVEAIYSDEEETPLISNQE